ncbi:hypothetical protein [Variovorax sp. PAMC 28711]|uniref:hypothetical protein n=1 Tax=Variovorax sp. PAMC 28711 TaxID=1795631 RepID=UPI00078BA2A3|nr:hypothetical protein [Variovorax sp. PAMC 28711]AMM23161.1 hypothetical protein AX767_01320 [Variovorax sp. PAMC 28711]
MSIIVYGDVILPRNVVLAGVSGRQTRQNDRTVNQGGYASANVVRDVTMQEYTIGIKAMSIAKWQQIEGVWEVTDSGAYGFLIEDPKDSVVTNGALQGYMLAVEFGTPGFGNGGPLYGLRQVKKAASSTRIRARAVTRPKGAPAVKRGGTPVVVGGSAGNIAISAAPVYVTFVPDATRTVTGVTVGATTSINLGTAIPGFVVGGRLWLQGITGADAALLNAKSHQITAIVGSIYTLATNTAGKAINISGEGRKYPQPDEALTWTGEFYTPVQFATDAIEWDLMRPGDFDDRLVSGPSIPLIEVREA